MNKKFFTGLIAAILVFILPTALLQWQALYSAKPWIMVGIGLLASLTQPAYSPIDSDAPAEDRGTARQLVWTVYLTMLLGVLEGFWLEYPESMSLDALAWAALALSVLGALLRAWAVVELGRFFTWHVRVVEEHSVVSTGPYRMLRHPSYTGAWFLYVGALVFMHAYISAALCGVLLLAAFLRRIRYEEAILHTNLGEAYAAYCRRVKRLVPYVW
jgi:protein-S-isoprenylcysteine O-methyltransferase